ncbi:MAG: hypothetical protein ACI3Z9_07650 [Candidatus Onthomorpha sp.]
MKKLLFVFALIFPLISNAQYSYGKIELNKETKQNPFCCKIGSKDSIHISPCSRNGVQQLSVGSLICKAETPDESLDYEIFANHKDKKAFVIVSRTTDNLCVGCSLYLFENGNVRDCGQLPVAAYTKDQSGRMNYNSILPHLSIVKVSNRYILSFETPLVVLFPMQEQEEILSGRDLFFTFDKDGLQMNK